MLSKKQKKILSHLREDSRVKLSTVASSINLPLSTVHDNFRFLDYFIYKYTVLPRYSRLGFFMRAFFIFRAGRNILKLLEKHISVNSLSAGKGFFFTECIFRNLKELYTFKEMLERKGARDVRFYSIISDAKKEGSKV